MVTKDSLENWLAAYEFAWENRDPDAAAAIFTPNALYYETPHADPFQGRAGIAEYWAKVTADQRDIDFASEIVAVEGNVGVASWTASLASRSTGNRIELNGVFVLQFAPDGLCSELREWWFLRSLDQ